MSDTYISPTGWDVQHYGDASHTSLTGQIVGPTPLDPPDATYIWPVNHLTIGTGTDDIQVGFAFFGPIDVTTNESPRFRIRAAGTVADGGYQSYPALDFFPLADPYNESAQIGSQVFPYGNTWGDLFTYPMGSVQEAEFTIPTAVQAALASGGVAVRFSVNGSTDGPGYIGMQIAEFRIAMTAPESPAPLRLYPRNNATRLYPRRRTRRPGTF